jgi:hypothetical protein
LRQQQQSAFAYQQQKKKGAGGGQQENSKNGNTLTIEECKNKGSASGFDTKVNQECANLICTHPGNNATCSRKGIVITPTPTPQPPTTGTLRVIKNVVCLVTDPVSFLSLLHSSQVHMVLVFRRFLTPVVLVRFIQQ